MGKGPAFGAVGTGCFAGQHYGPNGLLGETIGGLDAEDSGEGECPCLNTSDGDKGFRACSQLFKEVKPRPTPSANKPADYRLLRLEKILR